MRLRAGLPLLVPEERTDRDEDEDENENEEKDGWLEVKLEYQHEAAKNFLH
jgi:hypothetical protein